MTQLEKLYARLVANRASMPFRDFRRVLETFGFTLDRVNGSHNILKHPGVAGAQHPAVRRQDKALVEEFGLEMKK